MIQRTAILTCAMLAIAPLALSTEKPAPAPAPEAHAAAQADAHAYSKSSAEQSQAAEASIGDFSVSNTYKDRLQAPSVNAPPIYASGSCAYGASFSVNGPGVGLGGGKAKPDPDCNRRELVRVVAPLNPWLALKIACEDPLVVDMMARGLIQADSCQYVPPVPPAPTPRDAGPEARGDYQAAPVVDFITREEFERAMKRAVGK